MQAVGQTMPTLTNTAPGELAQAVGLVFETMLGLEAIVGDPDAGGAAAELPTRADLMTAAVYLGGKYRGAVLIHCLPLQACAFAGRFLSANPPESVDDEVLDVLGELANMVAGNLPYASLPGSVLSVPSVFEGPAAKLRICGSRAAGRTSFLTPSGPFWVTMVAASDSPPR